MNEQILHEIFTGGIIYIAPEYTSGIGDTCRIKTEKNSYLIENNIKTVINKLCAYLLVDYSQSKTYLKGLLGKGKNLPLVLDPDNIFICLKTRIPIGKNDGAMTYVNPKYIESYDYGILDLASGEKIYTFTADSTIKRNLKDYKYLVSDMNMRLGKTQRVV